MTNLIRFLPGTSAGPVATAMLEEFDRSYTWPIPSALRDLLRRGNASVPIDNHFPHRDNVRVIERVLGCIEGYATHPLGMYDIEVVHDQIGDRLDDPDLMQKDIYLWPIMALFGGDLVILDFRDETVWLWDHEQSTEFAPHLERLADSLPAFEALVCATSADP